LTCFNNQFGLLLWEITNSWIIVTWLGHCLLISWAFMCSKACKCSHPFATLFCFYQSINIQIVKNELKFIIENASKMITKCSNSKKKSYSIIWMIEKWFKTYPSQLLAFEVDYLFSIWPFGRYDSWNFDLRAFSSFKVLRSSHVPRSNV